MANSFDVLILTTHGRGYRLARDLAFEGKSVVWMDISANLGLNSKDWTGPFPAAVHPDSTDLDRRQFLHDNDLELLPQGLGLWHEEGLLETRGELVSYQNQKLQQNAAIDFISDYECGTELPQSSGAPVGYITSRLLHYRN